MKRGVILCAVFLLACSSEKPPGSSSSAGQEVADRVFLNGAVYTVDSERTWAEAVSVRDGHVTAVGSTEHIRNHIGDTTLVTDLEGQMMLPGLHDSHTHLLVGIMTDDECNVMYKEDLADFLATLAGCRSLEGEGEHQWITGGGWFEWMWEDANPNKAMLDELFPDRPVYLVSSFGHSALVNSRALELAGITRDSEDPFDGLIMRDPETGEPSGTLRDGAMMIVQAVLPESTMEKQVRSVRAAIDFAHSNGITAIIEPGLDEDLMAPVLEIADSGDFDLRAKVSLSTIAWHPGVFEEDVLEFLEDRDKWRRDNIDVDSVKMYMDGVPESGTGALLEPYLTGDFGLGPRFYTQEQIDHYMTEFEKMGLQIHVHSCGDAGTRMALNGFEAARKANGETGLRHQIVHLQLIDEEDRPRFGELNISATFQALWAWPDRIATGADTELLGKERAWSMYPIGSVHRAGGRIVGGSDYWVTELNPMLAIEAAVTRQDPYNNTGPTLTESERVDIATMIDAYTINGAYVMGLDDMQGSIEVGKRADFVVLDQNLFEIPSSKISETEVVMTVFDGETVYARP
jgi:predicted amidohydrolase YtcJ